MRYRPKLVQLERNKIFINKITVSEMLILYFLNFKFILHANF